MSSIQALKQDFDVIVIGGGASGMMAAGRAAMRGKRVLLIEKNAVLGKKLAITGGGRCNITNAEFDVRKLLAHYGEAADFLYSPFSQFGVQSTFDFFTERGLPLKVEERRRAFPCTEKATDVVKVLVDFLHTHKVTIWTNEPVLQILHDKTKITGVKTKRGVVTARSYVMATGGTSHAQTGSTGEGISWLEALGITTYAPNPDLVPLTVRDEWVKRLSGRSIEAEISFGIGKNSVTQHGKILFTHFGLSGPAILNAVKFVKPLLKSGPVSAHIDLFPKSDVGTLRAQVLAYFTNHKNQSLQNALKGLVPPGLVNAVLQQHTNLLPETKVHSVTKDERNTLADSLKVLPLTVTGTLGFDHAVVSDGGVALEEVDTRTMATKKYQNLYVTGDVLHIARPSGGYSLQLCWTTGWVAGSAV